MFSQTAIDTEGVLCGAGVVVSRPNFQALLDTISEYGSKFGWPTLDRG